MFLQTQDWIVKHFYSACKQRQRRRRRQRERQKPIGLDLQNNNPLITLLCISYRQRATTT